MTAPSPGSTVTSPPVWWLCVSKQGTGLEFCSLFWGGFCQQDSDIWAYVYWNRASVAKLKCICNSGCSVKMVKASHIWYLLLDSCHSCIINSVLSVHCWPWLMTNVVHLLFCKKKVSFFSCILCQGWHIYLAVLITEPSLNIHVVPIKYKKFIAIFPASIKWYSQRHKN